MINPMERLRQRQARRRYIPDTRPGRTGRFAKAAAIALVLILVTAALLELRRGGGNEAELAEYARSSGVDPLELVADAARSRRLVFIADVPAAPAPKRFAAEAVERIALGSGLDLLVLDVDSDEQPYIDRYLATSPEDASILLGRPRAVKEAEGTGRIYLDLYRTVWRVNEELGAARRIRIVAADAQGWPPARSVSPSRAAQMFGQRADAMLATLRERTLDRNPNARVLFFMDGLQTLRSGGARIQTGGTTPVETTWLAAQLAQQYPQDVYSVLVDAQPSRVPAPEIAGYAGTALEEPLRRAGVDAGFALRPNAVVDATSRTPIRINTNTGITFSLEPRAAPLSQLADAYILLGN